MSKTRCRTRLTVFHWALIIGCALPERVGDDVLGDDPLDDRCGELGVLRLELLQVSPLDGLEVLLVGRRQHDVEDPPALLRDLEVDEPEDGRPGVVPDELLLGLLAVAPDAGHAAASCRSIFRSSCEKYWRSISELFCA